MAIQKKAIGGAKPLPSRPGPPAEEQEEQQQQERPRSKADAFNNAEPETGINLPPGSYTAHIVGAVVETGDGEKEAVKFTYEIFEGDLQGKEAPTWYNLFDKEGNSQRGIGFLKRDFELLGQPALDYDDLASQLQTLQDERPLCNITVKKNGQWTNIYLQGLAEGV